MASIDDKKVVEDIEEQSEILNDYLSLIKSNTEYQSKKRQRKAILLSSLMVIYTLLAAGLLLAFKNNPNVLFWPIKITTPGQSINDLNTQIDNLNKEVLELQGIISSSSNNISVKYIDNRLTSLEKTISLNPEKALTAVLLREKQKNIEEKFIELRNEQARLDAKLDNFVTTVIIAPLFAAILGFAGWLIRGHLKKD